MAAMMLTASEESHSVCRAALPEYIVYEVSFDETTADLVVDGDKEPQHVMMIQGKISYCYAERDEVLDVVVPITVLTGTTAEDMLRALKTRVPAVVEGFADLGVPCCVVLNSDSATACKRSHSRCQQHMVSASLVSTASMFDLTNGSVCATLQLHKGFHHGAASGWLRASHHDESGGDSYLGRCVGWELYDKQSFVVIASALRF